MLFTGSFILNNNQLSFLAPLTSVRGNVPLYKKFFVVKIDSFRLVKVLHTKKTIVILGFLKVSFGLFYGIAKKKKKKNLFRPLFRRE